MSKLFPYLWIPKASPWHIILHHSLTKDNETVSWEAIRQYHLSLGWKDIGYHFGIEKVGDSYQVFTGRPIGTRGAHCRHMNMNGNSVGICFVGNYNEEDVPDAMYDVGIRLIAGLIYSTPCSVDYIFPHSHFNSNKLCPGIRFNMYRLKGKLKSIL